MSELIVAILPTSIHIKLSKISLSEFSKFIISLQILMLHFERKSATCKNNYSRVGLRLRSLPVQTLRVQ